VGADAPPWEIHNPPDHVGFTALIDRMREALEESDHAFPDQRRAYGRWCTGIAVRCNGKFEHVCSVAFVDIDKALRAYTELASMYLSDAYSVGVREDAKVPLARTIGRALAFADHGGAEYQEHLDHLVGRGGESLILGPTLITVATW
jgi:hypothetical protein